MTEREENNHWERLNGRLDAIEGRLANLETAETERTKRREEQNQRYIEQHRNDVLIENMVKDHDEAIHGNGRPGLLDRTKETETTIKVVSRLIKFELTLAATILGGVAYIIVEMM